MSFLVEVVVNRTVGSGKFLQTSHPPKAKHRPLPSSEGLMRILDAIVQPAANLALVDSTQAFERRAIGSKPIRHDLFDQPVATERFPEEFHGRFLIPPFRDEALEHLSFVIDGAPEIVFHPVDLHENLVEMPPTMPEIPHRLDAAAPNLGREDGAEPLPPKPHRLMGDVDASLVQQVLDVPQ